VNAPACTPRTRPGSSPFPQGRGADARLAHHSLESKDFVTALAALLRAMDEAEKLGAPGAALRHVEQALSIWDAVPESGRPYDVDDLKLLHEAFYFAGTSGEPERAVAYAHSAVQAVDAICHAWELVADTGGSSVRAWVLATRAGILRAVDQPDGALRSAQTAVADARAVGAVGAEASALVTLGTLADSAADFGEARLRQAERKAREGDTLNVELGPCTSSPSATTTRPRSRPRWKFTRAG
jgi:hypothetical protein